MTMYMVICFLKVQAETKYPQVVTWAFYYDLGRYDC